MTRARHLRLWLALGAVVAAAGLSAPYFNADRLGNRVRLALELAIGRRVEIGEVRVHFFPALGISVSDVVIHEEPLYGPEPAAYVTTLDARVKLSSLWRQRLEFASLRLDEPSINVIRVAMKDGVTRWNFESLMARAGTGLPEVLLSGGRVNFKFGRTKSMFYFLNADASLTAPRDGRGEWRLTFAGEPARTDRPAHGFGLLEALGRWRPGAPLEADLRLDRSALADLSTLVHGADLGVHGLVSARLRLAGAPGALRVSGSAQLDDVHRWDMMPPHAGPWRLALDGELDIERQFLSLEARPPGAGPVPLRIRLRAADYLSRPRWGMVTNVNGLPAAPVLDAVRHLGAPVPAGLTAEGTITGAAGYSIEGGFQGKAVVDGAALRVSPAVGVSLEQPVLVLNGGRIRLLPTRASWADSRARVEGEYNPEARAFRAGLDAEVLRLDAVATMGALAGVPVLSGFRGGSCRGRLRYESSVGAPGIWSGRLEVAGTTFPVPGLAEQVRLESASLEIQGARVALTKIDARAGPVAWSGEYRYEPDALRPHRFHFLVPELDAVVAERLLAPTLTGGRGFLARALGFGSTRSDWLEQRRAEGSIDIGQLVFPECTAENVRARVFWDADMVELTGISARVMSGSASGSLSVLLRNAGPGYRLAYRVEGVHWKKGLVRSTGVLQTTGFGSQLLDRMEGEGNFEGRTLLLDGTTELDSLGGQFELGGRAGAPRLRFSALELAVGDAQFSGKGASLEGGRLLLEFDDGNRRLRLSGTPADLKLDNAPDEPLKEIASPAPPG